MNYMYNCQSCANYRNENIWGNQAEYCAGNVHNPLKCALRKKIVNPDIQEFFQKTNERLNNAR